MKSSYWLNVAVATLCFAASALLGASTPTKTAPAQLRASNVIVILRDQKPELPALRGMRGTRAAALGAAQDPVVAHLQASGATRIHRFELINAVSAHVSAAEAELLAAHPLVQAVVPERVIRLPRLDRAASRPLQHARARGAAAHAYRLPRSHRAAGAARARRERGVRDRQGGQGRLDRRWPRSDRCRFHAYRWHAGVRRLPGLLRRSGRHANPRR